MMIRGTFKRDRIRTFISSVRAMDFFLFRSVSLVWPRL